MLVHSLGDINTYTIEIDYTTGNSFGSERSQEQIGLVWTDKNLARKALKSIKEHYKLHEELDNCNCLWTETRNEKDILKEVYSKDWYTKLESHGKEYWKYNLAAELDDGTWRSIESGMWIGYFETLHGAKIVSLCDDEDSFEL